MIQPRTQTKEYWEDFSLTEADIEHIYNHFLEVESPQTSDDVMRAVIKNRVAVEYNALRRRIGSRKLYQPSDSYAVGDELAFPVQAFAPGTVTAVRDGNNPDFGEFQVLTVAINKKEKQFAAGLNAYHQANGGADGLASFVKFMDNDELVGYYGSIVEPTVVAVLEAREEFVVLGGKWFITSLLAEVNIGHLNLAEAALYMYEGGPQTTDEIVVHLDLDTTIKPETQIFSLNYALLQDGRFDEVAPKNHVAWFLRQMEPDAVVNTPARLQYKPIEWDHAILGSHMRQLEQELADEWSDLDAADYASSVTVAVSYPHRVTGSLPLTNSIRQLLPLGRSPRQLLTFRDAQTGEEMRAWVVKDGRYIYGLQDWYEKNRILVGAYVTIKPHESDPHIVMIDYGRHNPRALDIRLATVSDGRVRFELQRRRIGCEYDDLLVVGTEFVAAIDAVWNRVRETNPPLSALIAAVLPELASLSPQKAVHAKTVYSIINMLRRVPPGPIFAELVRHPAFQLVGDVYWRFEPLRWRTN